MNFDEMLEMWGDAPVPHKRIALARVGIHLLRKTQEHYTAPDRIDELEMFLYKLSTGDVDNTDKILAQAIRERYDVLYENGNVKVNSYRIFGFLVKEISLMEKDYFRGAFNSLNIIAGLCFMKTDYMPSFYSNIGEEFVCNLLDEEFRALQ